jgi:hypothetical protein
MEAVVRTDSLFLEVQKMASQGYGWQDFFVTLKASGRIRGTQSEWEAIRRYVLGLGSAVARRYST